MKKVILVSVVCFGLSLTPALSQQKKSVSNQNEKVMNNTSKEAVQAFFNAFGRGDFQGILNSFHEDCTIIAVREGERADKQLYGSYTGIGGLKEFLGNLGHAFDTKAFAVDHLIGEGNVAFASGTFTHNIKATGKPYSSGWSLMCIVEDGKIKAYHFYEDSASFVEASKL